MASHYKHPRLLLLIKVTEEMFYLPKGQVVAPCRWAPTIYFRHLAMLVAHDAGFNHSEIGRAFERDRSTVKSGVCSAQNKYVRSAWWDSAACEMTRRWDDAINARKKAEARG